MSPLFGRKKAAQKTIAIVDVENGSVGGALVVLTPDAMPRLFAQTRVEIPMSRSLSATVLAKEAVHAVRDVLLHLGTVASRLRTHGATQVGEVDRVSVFLHAPWVSIHSDGESIGTDAPESLLAEIRGEAQARFGSAPVSFHAFGIHASPLMHGLFGAQDDSLVVSMTGEVTELFLAGEKLVAAATVPHGFNTMIRTLETHAGLTSPEAHSALTLLTSRTRPAEWEEALHSGISHLMKEIGETAIDLGVQREDQPILVLAPRNSGALLARAFAKDETLGELFPRGTVRDIRIGNLSPYITMHASKPDLGLMLGSLCVQSRFGIY